MTNTKGRSGGPSAPTRLILANRVTVGLAWTLVAVCSLVVGCGTADRAEPQGPGSPTLGAVPVGADAVFAFEQVVPGSEDADLYVAGPNGRDLELLRSPGGYPQWSPDGKALAFQACLNPPDCTTDVALLERSGGRVKGFTSPDPALEIHCGLAWSPDGKRLACEAFGSDDPKRTGIYSIRASDGEGLERLTKNPGGDDLPLAYSPDGSRLLLARTDPSRAEETSQALFIVPLGGGEPHRITPWGYADDVADWSPDGRTIVFGKDGLLYRVDPAGHHLAEITLHTPRGTKAHAAFDVGFSPDGRSILFSLSGSAAGIYTADLAGSRVKRLTSGDHHHANWSAVPSS
ncbi:MAG: TolB family protein [Marmoricola sp.]